MSTNLEPAMSARNEGDDPAAETFGTAPSNPPLVAPFLPSFNPDDSDASIYGFEPDESDEECISSSEMPEIDEMDAETGDVNATKTMSLKYTSP